MIERAGLLSKKDTAVGIAAARDTAYRAVVVGPVATGTPTPGINVIRLIAPFWPVFLKIRQKMKIERAIAAKATIQYPRAKAERAAATEESVPLSMKYS